MSTDSSKSSQFTIYGAMNPGVPAYFYFGSMPTKVFLYTAKPKSMIFAFCIMFFYLFIIIITFSGLRSLWINPTSLKYLITSTSCFITNAASYSSKNVLLLTYSNKSPSPKNSVTMYKWVLVLKIWCNLRMFGWWQS